jgi:nicotinamidase-related amidase
MLKIEKIQNIFLVGQDGNYCIKDSARGGKLRGFNVFVVESSVATNNEKKWKEEKTRLQSLGIHFIPLSP